METTEEEKKVKSRFGLANFERRRHPRFSVDLPIEYHPVNASTDHPGRAGNVSEGGLMAYLAEKPELGQYLQVKLFFPAGSDLEQVEMLTEVAWVDIHLGENRDYRSGLKFVDISPDHLNKLSSFLFNLSRI
ncbi:MAG: PilZ domain-containing protein [Deltaproteobacteria bacterium]|nr:PilZ domain-containing protein [Deltaproteobacteria bacterium]